MERFRQLALARKSLAQLQHSIDPPALEVRRWEKLRDDARNHLIQANQGLVSSIASRYRNLGLELEDLFQEGCIGLSTAIDRFDPHRGFQLSTFANPWIRKSITRALSNQSRTIRIPEERLSEIRKVKSVADHLRHELGHAPTVTEIAEEMQLPAERIRHLLEIGQTPLSLDSPIGSVDGPSIHDMLEDPSLEHPEQSLDLSTLKQWLEEACRTLTDRDYRVIQLHFGLGQETPRTQESIGREFSISRQRVSQILETATEKLRAYFTEKEMPKAKTTPRSHGQRPAPRSALTSVTPCAASHSKPTCRPAFAPQGLHLMQPPSPRTLAIRSVMHNPNHHLWNNNGTWFCKFRIKNPDGSVQRINQSLRTHCVEDARLRRDELMQAFQNPLGHAA
jgi:RNA polymerase sigma factor (sigma-70 family)